MISFGSAYTCFLFYPPKLNSRLYADGLILNIKMDFTHEPGAFGNKWGKEIKNDANALPSFEEMMEGIFKWYSNQMREKMKNKTERAQLLIIKSHRKSFNQILKDSNI